ncbi:hypothetical protein Gpo141_00005682 [Globisporangium polare]
MSWRWDGNDTENEISPGTIIGITAGAIVFLGVLIVLIANQSPPPSCFRVLDRYIGCLPFVWFFVMSAATIITATSSAIGSNLPIAVGGSCFLTWVAIIALVVWRASVNLRATQAEQGLGDNDGAGAVYAIAIDSGGHTSHVQHSGSYDLIYAAPCGDIGGSIAFDGGSGFSGGDTGGSGFSGGDTGGATSSSTGGGGGGGGGDGGGGC